MAKIIFLILSLTFLIGCGNNEPNSMDQLVTFRLYRSSSHYDYSQGEYVDRPNAWGYGKVTGIPVPQINFLTINEDTFSDQSDFRFDFGAVDLGRNYVGSHIRTFDDVNSVIVEVNTSEGRLLGEVSYPDTVKDIQADTSGALLIGTSVSVNWNCVNADYFEVVIVYLDTNTVPWNPKYWFGVTTDESLLVPAIICDNPGSISQFKITAINGAIPAKGMEPNMVGSGYGYLSYVGSTTRESSNVSFYVDS